MAETSPLLIHYFTDDEVEVTNILTNLKTLVPLYQPPNLVPSTPSWLSKRPRSASVSLTKSRLDRLKEDSAAVSGKGNLRNASPDSPLLLKSSPERCCVQGESDSTRDKKGANKQEAIGRRDGERKVPESDFPVQIDVTLNLCGQRHCQLVVSQLALVNGDSNPDLTVEPSPHGSACSSLTSSPAYSRPQFLFNLNLLPESTDTQLTPPYQQGRKPGQTPCDRAATYDGGKSQAETAKAARKRRLQIYRMKNGKGSARKAHPSSTH